MKKVLLIVLILIAYIGVNAQPIVYGRTVRFGFKLDPVFVNSLKAVENGIDRTSSGFGINYGLMADIMFRDGRGAFATGLEVAHASSDLTYSSTSNRGLFRNDAIGQDQNYKLRLQYLQIPLSVKLKTNEVGYRLRLWGQFGTYMGALLKSRLDYSYGSVYGDNFNAIEKTNKVNLGLLLGAGGEYSLADRTDLYFGLGFENGFTDITTNKDWKDNKVALNRWAIRLGVFF